MARINFTIKAASAMLRARRRYFLLLAFL